MPTILEFKTPNTKHEEYLTLMQQNSAYDSDINYESR